MNVGFLRSDSRPRAASWRASRDGLGGRQLICPRNTGRARVSLPSLRLLPGGGQLPGAHGRAEPGNERHLESDISAFGNLAHLTRSHGLRHRR
jgi:hypothetical protein